MGRLCFLIPERERLTPEAVQTAQVCSRDRLPFVTRALFSAEGELLVDREESESGNFQILWSIADRGPLLLSTATIMEREVPYQLPLELARGTLNRVRNLMADWQASGLTIPPLAQSHLTESLKSFVQAVARQMTPIPSAQAAERSIIESLAAIDAVSQAVVEHVADLRQRQPSKVVPLFAVRLSDAVPRPALATPLLAGFNAATIPFAWGMIEADEGRQNWSQADAKLQWCQANGLRICGGPLIELERHALPDWIYLWEGDFDNLLIVAGDYVRAVVKRYRGKVHFWNATGRLITGEALGLDEEQKLRLAGKVIETIRSVDTQAPVLVSFDQPWAEYMARREAELSPLQFAEALVRSDLGVAGIGLEINLGTGTSNTLPRDLFEFSNHLDLWGTLGLPLLLSLRVPSDGGSFTPGWQQFWLERYLPLVIARPTVQAIIWNQLLDTDADDFPHCGLVDSRGHAKPALAALAVLRKKYSA
jgi:Glycosyl hydrolase family 10